MRLPARVLGAGMAAGLAGCVTTGQPLQVSRPAAPPVETSPVLTRAGVALLYSPNTLALFDLTRKMGNKAGWQELGMLSVEFKKRFNRNFESVKAIDKLADETEAGLIALWDAYASITRTEITVENTLTFYDRARREIEKFQGKSTQPMEPFKGRANAQHAVDQSLWQLESAMVRSEKLQAAARAAARKSPAGGGGAAAAPPVEEAKSSDVDFPGYTRMPERPDDFAIVIGIENYSSIVPANYAERDAEAVRRHLIQQGFPTRNVIFLTGSKATNTAIKKYLEEWLPRNVKPSSRIFFYFSGHGAPDVSSEQAYLVPWDGDPNFLASTAYSIKELYKRLGVLPAKEVIVAMDACFSGSGGRSVLPKGARPMVTRVDTGSTASEKLVVFSAASDTEITSALDEQGHGIFTYYFLKGFGGAAKDSAGRVTAKGLYEYLKPQVKDEARRQNREQTPGLKAGQESLVLTKF